MFHVPAHKQSEQSKAPGQVPVIPVQRKASIVQRIEARKLATDKAVAESIAYARECGYSANRHPAFPGHVCVAYLVSCVDGYQHKTLHHSKVRGFIDSL